MDSTEFINAYVANMKKKLDDLMGSLVLLETKCELTEKRVLELEDALRVKTEESVSTGEAHSSEISRLQREVTSLHSLQNEEIARLNADCARLGEALHLERERSDELALQISLRDQTIASLKKQAETLPPETADTKEKKRKS